MVEPQKSAAVNINKRSNAIPVPRWVNMPQSFGIIVEKRQIKGGIYHENIRYRCALITDPVG